MNAEAVASSQFPNNAADTTVSKDTEKGAAGSDLFLRLILAMLAEAQGQGEMAKGEMLDLAGTKQTDLAILPDQDAKEKGKNTSIQETGILGALLVGNQSHFHKLTSNSDELLEQPVQPVNAECCRAQNVPQEGMPVSQAGSPFSLFSLAPKNESGQPAVNQNSYQQVPAEISDPTANGQRGLSGENNLPLSQDQPLLQVAQDKEGSPVWNANKNGIQPQKLQLYSKEAKVELLQQENLQGKTPANSKVHQEYYGEPDLREELVAQKVLKQATQIPLKPGEDSSKENAVLQGSQQEFIRSVPFLPSELSREQTDTAVAKDVIRQVVDQAHLFVGRNVASLKLQLKPEFLGNLKLTISVEHGMVHARFTANNAAVANLIETRLPELQHALADRGISWHQLSVTVDTQAHSGGFDYPRQEGTGYQHPYPYAFKGEPSAQEDYLEQGTASHPGVRWVVDYLV